MGRPRKKPVPPADPSVMATPPSEFERFRGLTEREKNAAIRSKIRKRIPLDLKIDEFELMLDLAEEFGEEMSVVVRACFRFGLRHHRQWASKSTGISPFTEGDWTPRSRAQLDPEGTRLSPPIPPAFPYRPQIEPHQAPLRIGERTYSMPEEVEAVFAPPPPVPPSERAFRPNGATISLGAPSDETPPSTPFDGWGEGPTAPQPYPVDDMVQPPLYEAPADPQPEEELPAEAYL